MEEERSARVRWRLHSSNMEKHIPRGLPIAAWRTLYSRWLNLWWVDEAVAELRPERVKISSIALLFTVIAAGENI